MPSSDDDDNAILAFAQRSASSRQRTRKRSRTQVLDSDDDVDADADSFTIVGNAVMYGMDAQSQALWKIHETFYKLRASDGTAIRAVYGYKVLRRRYNGVKQVR